MKFTWKQIVVVFIASAMFEEKYPSNGVKLTAKFGKDKKPR